MNCFQLKLRFLRLNWICTDATRERAPQHIVLLRWPRSASVGLLDSTPSAHFCWTCQSCHCYHLTWLFQRLPTFVPYENLRLFKIIVRWPNSCQVPFTHHYQTQSPTLVKLILKFSALFSGIAFPCFILIPASMFQWRQTSMITFAIAFWLWSVKKIAFEDQDCKINVLLGPWWFQPFCVLLGQCSTYNRHLKAFKLYHQPSLHKIFQIH